MTNPIEQRLRARARELLEAGAVELFLGYRQGSSTLRVAPFAARTAADAEKLVWNAACVPNLAGTLRKHAARRVGVAMKACDARSVVELLRHRQLERERLHIVGVVCGGMVEGPKTKDEGRRTKDEGPGTGELGPRTKDQGPKTKDEGPRGGEGGCTASSPVDCTSTAPSPVVSFSASLGAGTGCESVLPDSAGRSFDPQPELLAKCRTCASRVPALYDELIGEAGGAGEAASAERFAGVVALEALDAPGRLAFWSEQLSRCTLCYACQAICPLCFCKECALTLGRDDPRRQGREPASVFAFHLVRAYHLAERCTGCDECERVCPEDIPLSLICRKLEQDRGRQ